jgi:hypothetical protein
MRLSLREIEDRVAALGQQSSYGRDFIFNLLLAYGRTKSNVERLRSTTASSLNVAADRDTEVLQKKVLYFKEVNTAPEAELFAQASELSQSPLAVRYEPRFVIITDYVTVIAKDTRSGDAIGFPITDVADHFTFFLPWAGMEKAQYAAEAHADVKAAERMAKLFDELIKLNPEANQTVKGRHALNLFFTRLLFCFFAEDTGIFAENQFTGAVAQLTQVDGSDVHELLTDLFITLDTASPADKPRHLAEFPYVNGRLFTVADTERQAGLVAPIFNKKARDYLLESGKLQWSQINPDIFGSMFQAIVTPGQRSDLGQHYTSVPNILKTIEPLFLDELKAEYEKAQDNEKKLLALLRRVATIKVFDPACGSGNFLIIAYKELRKLEHQILERLQDLQGNKYTLGLLGSQVNIENFYGIEIDDFAAEIAVLSLWIAKHQMNLEFRAKFGTDIPLIPLKEMGQVKQGNATRVDWQKVCPNDGQTEIYLIGNPPYVGGKLQSKEQKDDFEAVFQGRPYSKNLDYIALWFVKGADYIQSSIAQLSFVTTNSVTQGEHVGLLFPMLFEMGLEIGYAYTSFKWENNARRNAGVTVAVINLRNVQSAPKRLFAEGVEFSTKNINGYLADGPNVTIERRKKPLGAQLPSMVFGSMPRDGGGLLLTPLERGMLLESDPWARTLVKRYLGSAEFINDIERYCLWIEATEAGKAKSSSLVATRLDRVAASRAASAAASTAGFAAQPHRFVQVSYKPTDSIIVPSISSERREYIPIGFVGPEVVISNKAFAVYDAEPWVFGLLTSRMHMAWTNAVSGRMRSDYQYSNTIVYNNFPVPTLSDAKKEELTEAALRVLDVREYHSEATLAELYDPDKMPENLRLAHHQLDLLVDGVYRDGADGKGTDRAFVSDEERLSLLFEMYAKMTENEAKK